METIETLARQVDAAESVRDLVRTMKSLAAASIRQYEQAVAALSGYDRTVELALQSVVRTGPPTPEERAGREGGTGVIVLGSDQGLCGTFNEQVVERLRLDVDAGRIELDRLRVLAVGIRAADRLVEAGVRVEDVREVAASAVLLPDVALDLLLAVDAWGRQEGVGTVHVYGSRPTGQIGVETYRRQLLPISPERLRRLRAEPWPSRSVPRHTIDRSELLSTFARHFLFVTLTRSLAWSSAAEHASRLLAMQAAERSIEERLDALRASYHHLRQTAITTELLDVVAGAEAVGSDRRRR
jgi:F-type H+-transporting ATPase subunit gamma